MEEKQLVTIKVMTIKRSIAKQIRVIGFVTTFVKSGKVVGWVAGEAFDSENTKRYLLIEKDGEYALAIYRSHDQHEIERELGVEKIQQIFVA